MLVAVFAVIGVGVIQAQDEMNGVPVFSDGRVNNWQMDEPVAVYCVFDHSEDVNVGIFQQIDGLGIEQRQAASMPAPPTSARRSQLQQVMRRRLDPRSS